MLIRRLRYWLRADKRYDDLRAEMGQHLHEKVAELRNAGRSDADANAEARRLFGNVGLKQEASRQIWIARYWSEFWQDLRYGIRLLTRSPGSTMVMIFALALGIGVNTAVFTAYKVIIDRPLDARAPEEMVNMALISGSGVIDERFSYQDYEAYRNSLRSFRGLIAYKNSQITFSEAARNQGPADSRAELVSVAVVSENYFEVLGRKLLQGRTFGSMTSAGLMAAPAVLITEHYWERRFAREPSILGRTIYLNGAPVVVAGITPRDLIGTSQQAPTFWVPATLKLGVYTTSTGRRGKADKQYRLFGRLAPGVTIAQAQAEMTSVFAQLRVLNSTPAEPVEYATAVVWPGSPFPRPQESEPGLRLAILLIMIAAGSVLAVACANVGGLRLARARARENELHTRLALGASRLRVVRQLLTESALSGLLAGALAFFLSWVIFRVSLITIADTMPVDQGTLVFDATPDLAAFAYAFAVSMIAGVLSGLAPAIEGSRTAISSSSRSTTLTAGGRRLQNTLVSVQVALSMVLLIVGAVAIRNSIQSLVADTGYETQRVFDLNFRFPETAEYNKAHKAFLVAQVRAQTAARPGVTAVTSALPPGLSAFQTAAAPLMETSTEGAPRILYYSHVQANYFETLDIPITRGRGFAPEAGQPEHSVVLSEAASSRLWPGENPVGRRLRLGALDERARSRGELFADLSAGQVYEVAGVVGNTRGRAIDGSNSEEIYVLLPDERIQDYPLLVRTTSDPIRVMRGIDPLVSAIDPNIVVNTTTLEELRRLSPAFMIPGIAAAVASTVGLFALLLAVMGIYGTVSYICVLRTREVGIRLSLGAQKRDVVRLILRESAQPVLIGLLVGILLAAATSYLAQGLLFGLHGVDIFAFIGVPVLLLAVALLASYLPTLRVIRIDPVVALRHE